MVRLLIDDVTGRLGRRVGHEHGQAMAEYALLISLIAVTIVAATMIAFRGTILAAFDTVARCFTNMPC